MKGSHSFLKASTLTCILVFLGVADGGSIERASSVPVFPTPANGPIRALIDVSKNDGIGTWWAIPGTLAQATDPAEPHYGTPVVEFLRSKGWSVTEAPRGKTITAAWLRSFDVVIRPYTTIPATSADVAAYREAVQAGTRLLLGYSQDAVSQGFGVRFTGKRIGSPDIWREHTLTEGLNKREMVWTVADGLPATTVALAWMENKRLAQPMLGYFPNGKGQVVFMGHPLVFQNRLEIEAVMKNVVKFVETPIDALPKPGPLMFASTAARPESPLSVETRSMDDGRISFSVTANPDRPLLVSPADNETLRQPQHSWEFEWEEVRGARAYQITVLGPRYLTAWIYNSTRDTHFVFGADGSYTGYIPGMDLAGWTWQVRAQWQNGEWGPWSDSRTFAVTPFTAAEVEVTREANKTIRR